MIVYLAKTGFLDPLEPLLTDWSPPLRDAVRIMSYSEVFSGSSLPGADVFIFADLERLTSAEKDLASRVRVTIREQSPEAVILNDPAQTLCRFEVLTELHRVGVNPFRCYRPADTTTPDRFPVFLRYEHDHTGATSGLAQDQGALDRALVRSMVRGHALEDLLIVEFLDTRDPEGLFKKYGAFVVGDRIIPRHILFDTEWVVKSPGLKDKAKRAQEMEYLRANPHESQLREIARLAHVQYGRIDYGLWDGDPIVWEINTNPVVIWPRNRFAAEDLPKQEFFVPLFADALLYHRTDRGRRPVTVPALGYTQVSPSVGRRVKQFFRRHRALLLPVVLVGERALIPFRGFILKRWKRRHS